MADRYALTSLLTVGGTAWDEIAVLVVDDSTLPAGASLLPIIGTPLLSRFERVTFNFANKVVIFDSKADAKSSR